MRVAVVPAAGKGTRFYELGNNYTKTLLPFDGVPILERIIEKLSPSFDEIRIVVSENSDQVETFLQELNEPKVRVLKVPSNGPQGPARSFMQAVTGAESHVFLHLSDTLFDVDFGAFEGDWVSVFRVDEPSRWCMINPESEFKDKPQDCGDEFLAITGAYSFSSPECLRVSYEAALETIKDREFQLSDVLKIYALDHKFDLREHESEQLLDFGTIDEYFKNNRSNRSRYFNKIEYNHDFVRKSSLIYPNELLSEALWLKYAPKTIQPFLPKIYGIDTQNPAYEMERIHSIKLRDLFVHLDRKELTWRPIISEIGRFLDVCKESEIEAPFWKGVCNKTLLRRPDLGTFVDELWQTVVDCGLEHQSTYFHGDLHFNNMFFDFSKNRLTLIDPRGEFFGHWLYDVAKLVHSVIGKFDFIDSRLFSRGNRGLKIYSGGTEELEALFKQEILGRLSPKELVLVYKTTASLFASMQPLHTDFPEKNLEFEAAFHYFNNLA